MHAFIRFALTFGAALWFILVQPLLQALLEDRQFSRIALIIVQMFSVGFLIRSLVFLVVYFIVLWVLLRWRTQSQVEKHLRRGNRAGGDLRSRLSDATLDWAADLLAPIRRFREQLEALLEQLARFQAPQPRIAA